MKSDAIFDIAQNIFNCHFKDLPDAVVYRTKQAMLDTTGAIVAGSTAPGTKEVSSLVATWKGYGESTAYGFLEKTTADNAAFVNTTLGRARDIDDYHVPTGDHPSISTIPAAMAVAEAEKSISGKDLITAIVLGEDVVLRIRDCTNMGPWTTGTYAPFAAATASAKIKGFSEEKIRNALGLSFCEASNTRQAHRDGSLAVRVHHGLAVREGLIAAELAGIGIDGPLNVLEGDFGLYASFHNNEYEREKLLNNLGTHFEGVNASIKPYPCCGFTHRGIDAVLELVYKYNISYQDVAEIEVLVNRDSYVTVCEPADRKKHPSTIVDAQFSIPFTLAVALIRKDVFIDDFTVNSITDPELISLAEKINCKIDSRVSLGTDTITPNIVTIILKDGRQYSTKVEHVKGSPQKPMTWEETIGKFLKCLKYADRKFDAKKINLFIDKVTKLEEISDVSELWSNLFN